MIRLADKGADWYGDAYPHPGDVVGAERQHRLIAALRHESAKPLLVAGAELLTPATFRTLLQVIQRIATRAFLTDGIHKSKLADFYIHQAKRIRDRGQSWSPESMWGDALAPESSGDVFALDMLATCSDESFKRGVRRLSYESTGDRSLIKYLLLAIESFDDSEGRPSTEAQFRWDKIHLDHIAPQSAAEDPIIVAGIQHSIGNLTPVSGGKNTSLGKTPYGAEKRRVYVNSKVLMTRAIAMDFGSWTPEDVLARTETVVELSARIWSLSPELWDEM